MSASEWRQCDVLHSVPHECLGDATYGQYDSGPKVCEAFMIAHKEIYPHVADSWVFTGRIAALAAVPK